MCGTCGCGSGEEGARILMPGTPLETHHHPHHEHGHHHGHDHHHHGHDHHHHAHDHDHHDHMHTAAKAGEVRSRVVAVEQDVLRHNDVMAARNQGYFEARNILALNLVSSPGSGKTSILERTLKDLSGTLDFYVIEGDQQTTRDAERIAALQVPVRQINTGKGCHLESDMIYEAVRQMEIAPVGVLMIENVGNLVCPSMFHLGEKARVVIISVTEGEDKPIKYPDMFHTSDLCLINKTDLLPYVACDLDRLKGYALQVNPNLKFLEVSAQTGDGMEAWYEWLQQQHQLASES